MAPSETLVDGPYFEDLSRGDRLDESPGLTLTEGLAAAHRAVAASPCSHEPGTADRADGQGGTWSA